MMDCADNYFSCGRGFVLYNHTFVFKSTICVSGIFTFSDASTG